MAATHNVKYKQKKKNDGSRNPGSDIKGMNNDRMAVTAKMAGKQKKDKQNNNFVDGDDSEDVNRSKSKKRQNKSKKKNFNEEKESPFEQLNRKRLTNKDLDLGISSQDMSDWPTTQNRGKPGHHSTNKVVTKNASGYNQAN